MNPTFLGAKIDVIFKTTEWSELVKILNFNSSGACLVFCDNNTISVYTISTNDPAILDLVKTKVAEKIL